MRRPTPKRPPVSVARNVIQGGSGGILGGALLGLVEACYHLATGGVPDLVSPFYATVLYGVLGLGLGIGAGIALSLWERVLFHVDEATAWAAGFAGAIAPLLTLTLYYLANKVKYLEQGVPTEGKIGVLILGLGIPLAFLLLLPFPLSGGMKGLLKGKGLLVAWGGLLLVTGAVAESGIVPDAREGWARGKTPTATVADRPDVLVIMVDTLRADHLQPYGSSLATPTLQALADDGLVFEKAFAQASWTRASGASIFTSRLPSSHSAATKASRLPEGVTTWAEVLQPKGVATGALVNNINMTSTFGFDQGFDVFYYEAPAYRFGATESVFALTWYKVLHKASERLLGGHKAVERFYQPADVVLGDARTFIEANDAGRWALFVHLMEPHDPYFEHPSVDGSGTAEYNGVGFARAEVEHPDPQQVDYLKKVYADEVVFLDQRLAPFLAWLKEAGHYDDTLIVVTSDHGEEFFEHGGFWHGTTLYDEQIHVPLVVKLPGQEHAGTRVPWQVRSIDIAPTVATALGLAPAEDWEGTDLLPDVEAFLAQAVAPVEEPEPAVALDAPVPADVVADPAEPAAEPEPVPEPEPAPEPVRGHPMDRVVVSEEDFEGNVLAAIRARGFKYLRANEGNPRGLPTEELFDVLSDPGETETLLGSGKAVDGMYPEDVSAALGKALGHVLSTASAGAAEAGTVTMSPAECEQLKLLGYLSGDEDCG